MTVYRLDPIENRLKQPNWRNSATRDACWVEAGSEEEARRRVEVATLIRDERDRGGRVTLHSPWRDATMVDCRADPDFEITVPDDAVITVYGQIYRHPALTRTGGKSLPTPPSRGPQANRNLRFCPGLMFTNGGTKMPEDNKVTYEVVPHDGGWAYRMGDTYSETFATREVAATAAWAAAREQEQEGQTEIIEYQDADGTWRTELADGTDRPEADVEVPRLNGEAHDPLVNGGHNPGSANGHRAFDTAGLSDDDDYFDNGERPRVAMSDSVRELVRDHPLPIVLSVALFAFVIGRLR